MHWDTSYSNPDYRLDQELTEELRYSLESAETKASLKVKVVTVLAPIAIFLIVWPLTHILIAAGLATMALAICLFFQIRVEGDATSAHCPACGTRLKKEEEGNIEYFVCHHCKTYSIGRMWS